MAHFQGVSSCKGIFDDDLFDVVEKVGGWWGLTGGIFRTGDNTGGGGEGVERIEDPRAVNLSVGVDDPEVEIVDGIFGVGGIIGGVIFRVKVSGIESEGGR